MNINQTSSAFRIFICTITTVAFLLFGYFFENGGLSILFKIGFYIVNGVVETVAYDLVHNFSLVPSQGTNSSTTPVNASDITALWYFKNGHCFLD